ncbi:MAG: hypothetical protein JWL98_1733 [Xanthomonadaceae bacterium]|nr:hypothetical protein [Xanthomonadaceae bacterium]
MNALSTLLYFVLSLFGVDLGSHVYIDRIRADGTDTLYSKVVAQPTVTRFECLRSASGQCYYTVFASDCAASGSTSAAECVRKPVEHFALARGGIRQIAALPTFRLCVSSEAGIARPDCG